MSLVPPLPPECDHILIDAERIRVRVAQLGAAIAANSAGADLRLVTVLKGGLFFLADLCRTMSADLSIDFMSVAAYVPGGGASVQVTKDLDDDVAGAHVILVEDVVDTGLTVNYVLSLLRARDPACLEVCALFDKPARRIAEVPIAYRGFEMGEEFLVGYGLDLDGRFRNLPYIASLKEEAVFG